MKHASPLRRRIGRLALLCLASFPISSFATSSFLFEDTGLLATERGYHTATLLPDGRVLAAGGNTGLVPTVTAEIYNATTGIWTPTGSMKQARYRHTATLLPNGLVLIVGGLGNNDKSLDSTELYNPATGNWTSTGALVAGTATHSATLLPDGRVLVAGGGNVNGALATAQLYDPATGVWTPTGSLLTARFRHEATLLPNGLVLVSGGKGAGGALKSAELYNPATGAWTQTGSMMFARFRHTQTLLLNGLVLAAGGLDVETEGISSTELYNPAAGTWMPTGALNVSRAQHTATLLPNGLVVVVGGFHGQPTATSELYDPATATWSLSGDMIKGRSAHATVLLPSGEILVVAGVNGDPPLSDPAPPEFDNYTLKEAEIGIPEGSPTPTPTPTPAPPVITKQPSNQRVHVGERATFKVLATGTPPLTYQWTKNGTEIPGAVAAKYTTPPLTAQDDGSLFAVTVSNSGGSTASRSATVFVRLAASVIRLSSGFSAERGHLPPGSRCDAPNTTFRHVDCSTGGPSGFLLSMLPIHSHVGAESQEGTGALRM
jgi:hypothetical protein